jgi:multiple sugar transport system substrate-binding protein
MADLLRDSIDTAEPRPRRPRYAEVSAAVLGAFHPPGAVDPASTPRHADDLVRAALEGD